MHLGYGLITAQHHPNDQRSDVEIYREAIDLAVEAERLGFETVWTSEHHFVDDGYMPSQLPFLAAVAARTERIRLGTGVLLAPMFDPLHLAEDAATVDLISNGRLILGLGIGWRDEEFAGFGTGRVNKGHRLEAIIEVLRQAWSDELATGDGYGLYRFPGDGLNVTPKPAQPGGPPIWIGAKAPVAIERAGRVADGYLGSGTPPDVLSERIAAIRTEAEKVGRSLDDCAIGVHRMVFAWRDGDAWERVRDAARYIAWKYAEMEGSHSSRERNLPPPMTADEEAELRERVIAGTPEEVAERLRAYRDVLGPEGHFVFRSYFPGLDPVVQRESMRILAQEVAPLLR